MNRFAFCVILVLALMMGSCTPGRVDDPSRTQTAFPATPSSGTPTKPLTPTPDIVIEDTTLREDSASATVVIGLVHNASTQEVADITLEVRLRDAEGNLLAQQQVSPLFTHLAPDEKSPYITRFEHAYEGASTEVEIAHVKEASFDRAFVTFTDLATFTTEDGEHAILGYITNPNEEPLRIHDFGFLAVSDSGEIEDLATSVAGPTVLAPGQASPFLATLDLDPSDWELVPYADATLSASLPPVELTFSYTPRLESTDQGLPFVIGEIQNDAGFIRWVRLLISAHYQDRLLSCTIIEFPIPINAGESRAFLETNLPGLRANTERRRIALDDVEIQAQIELNFTRDFDEIGVPLAIEIELFEPIGSALMLRGKLTNPEDAPLRQPTVLATVRTTEGELVSAGWLTVADTIAASQTLDFVLPLTLPRNTHTVMSEFDILAVGFAP